MKEDFNEHNEDQDYSESLNRFEQMLKKNEHYFFDVEEFEILIDHYLEKIDTNKAKKVVDISLQQHPSSSTLKLKKAQFFAATHKPNKALEILQVIELLEPFNVEIFSIKASIHSQLRQHHKAIENYYKALKLVSDEAEKTNILIHIAFEHENLNPPEADKAIEILKKLLKENPENETVIYELAFCYNLKNDIDGCIEFFSQFTDNHPYNYSAWYNLGTAYNRAELYEKAIDAYDFTIAIKEDFSSAYFNKANSLALLNKYEKAIETYKETFLYEKPDATTYYYIGECFEKLDDTKAAFSNYLKVTKLDPFNADAWAGLAVINEADNKTQSAIYYIKKAIELENDNSEYWYIKGDILSKMGLVDEAIITYDKVIELDEENEDIWLDKAEVVKDYENIENGILILCEGLEKQPENYLIYTRLIPYLLIKGKVDEAVQNLIILLTNNKELLSDLTAYYPEIINFKEIINVIETFNDKK
jgi:tetratricopeptide (TPR) repeat protein